MIFYESPVRLLRTLEHFMNYFGEDRLCSVAREISKKFETYHRGTLSELQSYFAQHEAKGEIVLLLKGNTE